MVRMGMSSYHCFKGTVYALLQVRYDARRPVTAVNKYLGFTQVKQDAITLAYCNVMNLKLGHFK
jgi:hypothetical protein